jgi:hypothetical protein
VLEFCKSGKVKITLVPDKDIFRVSVSDPGMEYISIYEANDLDTLFLLITVMLNLCQSIGFLSRDKAVPFLVNQN